MKKLSPRQPVNSREGIELTFNVPMSFPLTFAAASPAVREQMFNAIQARSRGVLIMDGMGSLALEFRNDYRVIEPDLRKANHFEGMTPAEVSKVLREWAMEQKS